MDNKENKKNEDGTSAGEKETLNVEVSKEAVKKAEIAEKHTPRQSGRGPINEVDVKGGRYKRGDHYFNANGEEID